MVGKRPNARSTEGKASSLMGRCIIYSLVMCLCVPLCALVCLGGDGANLGWKGSNVDCDRPRDCRDETEKALDGMRLCSVSIYGSAAVVFQKWT